MQSSSPGDQGVEPGFTFVVKSQAVGNTGCACPGAAVASKPTALIAVAAASKCILFTLIRRNIGIPFA
jgi:hypothetical protein